MPTVPAISQISLGNLTLFAVGFADWTASFAEALATRILCAREWRLWQSFALERRRHEWLAGRLAAKAALQAGRLRRGLDSVPASALSVLPAHARAGPARIDGTGHISISHSCGMAVAVNAARPIGVDIERLRPFQVATQRQFLNPDEFERLGRAAPDDPRLTLIWSLKEAILKARYATCITDIRKIEWLGWGRSGAAVARDDGRSVPGAFAGVWRGYALALSFCPQLRGDLA